MMNEFEKLLSEIQPAEGKSDPMQIMFRAGQNASEPRIRSARLSSKLSIFAALGYTALISLWYQSSQREDDMVPAINNGIVMQSEVESSDFQDSNSGSLPQPNVELVGDFQSLTPEMSLDDPESLIGLGHRMKQLGDWKQPEETVLEDEISPFAIHRLRSSEVF